ncbi:carbohydrate porin [Bacteroides sp.]|uniref:carbohydrate porin n=1 Tax=Bacteroides sp. TaxID=29523 RepID=UPI0026375245|nr:carbohydrate porin [Bacteroides sp.]
MLKKWILYLSFAGGNLCGSAQVVDAIYTTEVQYAGDNKYNWVNLLRVEASLPVKNGSFDLVSQHIYKLRKENVADDWQVFSNIEEDNLPFAIAVLGYRQNWRNMSLFVGVRNVNEDYFDSSVTSLFTNSSCGIFPTLSANYPLPNYPLSALCLDYKLQAGNWSLESSLYNGVAHSAFCGDGGVFALNPRRDGVFSISSLSYQSNVGNYFFGFALHNRMYSSNVDGNPIQNPPIQAEEVNHQMNVMWWWYAEQLLYKVENKRIDLLAQYSENRSVTIGCRQYAGLGATYSATTLEGKKREAGVIVDYARFTYGYEVACEVTYKWHLTDRLSLQPALYWIKNSQRTYCIGMLRASWMIK